MHKNLQVNLFGTNIVAIVINVTVLGGTIFDTIVNII